MGMGSKLKLTTSQDGNDIGDDYGDEDEYRDCRANRDVGCGRDGDVGGGDDASGGDREDDVNDDDDDANKGMLTPQSMAVKPRSWPIWL